MGSSSISSLSYALLMMILSFSCAKESLPSSDVQGSGSALFKLAKIEPKNLKTLLRTSNNIDQRFKLGVASSNQLPAKFYLKKVLAEAVTEADGIPRWQIRHILSSLLRDSKHTCGGVSCSKVFGIKESEIEPFLDEIDTDLTDFKNSGKVSREKSHIHERLIASFNRDYNPYQGDKSDQTVTFENPLVEEAIRSSLKTVTGPIKVEHLKQITDLNLNLNNAFREKSGHSSLEDILKLPNLRSIDVTVDHTSFLTEIAKFGDALTSVSIKWTASYAYVARVSDLEILGSLPRLEKIKLDSFSLIDSQILPDILPQIKHLTVASPSTPINDNALHSFSQLKRLHRLTLEGIPYQHISRLSQTLPKSIHSVDFGSLDPSFLKTKKGPENCGDFSGFKIFSNASTMQVSGCRISGLSGFGRPMGWEILSLSRCTTQGDLSIYINPSDELTELLVLKIADSPNVKLMEEAKKQLAVRLAKSKQENN